MPFTIRNYDDFKLATPPRLEDGPASDPEPDDDEPDDDATPLEEDCEPDAIVPACAPPVED